MSEQSEIRDVSDTALWVAHYRAEESARPDAMFHDPLAKLLVGERGAAIARAWSKGRYTAWSVVTRTVLIDEYVLRAVHSGVDAVVNLGAGLDTRPYRLELPASLEWVEADFPHLIDYKENILRGHTPRCALARVGVDLSDSAARRSFLASVATGARNILVITEGVVPYLSEAQVTELAADLRAEPRFTGWVAEYFSPRAYRYLKAVGRSARLRNAPFQFFPQDWDRFFLERGWMRKEIHYNSEIAQRFHRRPPMPWWAGILLRFANQEALEQMRTNVGYMLLAPRPDQ